MAILMAQEEKELGKTKKATVIFTKDKKGKHLIK